MYTFTREFPHGGLPQKGASDQAFSRFKEDKARFPVGAYEPNSLVWKDDNWRTLEPMERAQIHMVPKAVVEATRSDASYCFARAAGNSAMGNGFHIPSLMMALIILAQLTRAEVLRPPMYAADELGLRARVAGSAWQPGLAASYPGIYWAADIIAEAQRMLPEEVCSSIPWASALSPLIAMGEGLASLQIYWVDSQLRGLPPLEQGPAWLAQRSVATLKAAFGEQRASGSSKRGLHTAIPAGTPMRAHLKEACNASHPFNSPVPVDDDIKFAVATKHTQHMLKTCPKHA
jgi:hypothetical protein